MSTRVSFAAIKEDGFWDQITLDVPDKHASGVCPEHSAMAWFMAEKADRHTIQCAVLDWNVPTPEEE